MTHADPEDRGRGIAVSTGHVAFVLKLVLGIGKNAVDVRALRERIVVANGSAQALNFGLLLTSIGRIIAVFKVSIADSKHAEAAAERGIDAGDHAVALELIATEIIGNSSVLVAFARALGIHVVVVLRAQIGLHNLEVVGAAEREGIAVVGILAINVIPDFVSFVVILVPVVGPVVPVGCGNEAQAAKLVGRADSCVAVGRRLAFRVAERRNHVLLIIFDILLVLRIHIEGILRIDAGAGEFRRLVGEGVVEAAVANHVGRRFHSAGPGCAERRDVAHQAIRAIVTERFP